MLEKENGYGATLISFKTLEKTHPDLFKWLKSIVRFGNVDTTCLIFSYYKNIKIDFISNSVITIFHDNINEKIKKSYIRVKFFTSDYVYSISAKLPIFDEKNNKPYKGYLGCVSSNRKSLVGETWTRGRDLADDDYSKKTWNKILADIVSHEMKNLQIEI